MKAKHTKDRQATIRELRKQIEDRDLTLANIRRHYEAVIVHQRAELEGEAKDSAETIQGLMEHAQRAGADGRVRRDRIEKTAKALIYRRAELLAEVERLESLLESLGERPAQQNAA